ncbi:MAG: hypothetical protein ACRDSP_03900 [Pseudonocardiaceae bacterium]
MNRATLISQDYDHRQRTPAPLGARKPCHLLASAPAGGPARQPLVGHAAVRASSVHDGEHHLAVRSAPFRDLRSARFGQTAVVQLWLSGN